MEAPRSDLTSQMVSIYQDTKRRANSMKLKPISTAVYNSLLISFDIPALYTDLKIEVNNNDTIDEALTAIEKYSLVKPLVLNMASDFKPGGGVEKGSRAQEECLFRRTNYFQHLNNNTVKYPLQPGDVIYTPNVAVLKNSKYELMEKIVYLDFIACPAIRKPHLNDGKLNRNDRRATITKIKMILETAAYHGHDSLILGALGCGAFGNPPDEIASLFKECIYDFVSKDTTKKYPFKYISFAVYSRSDSNYDIFSKTLKQPVP